MLYMSACHVLATLMYSNGVWKRDREDLFFQVKKCDTGLKIIAAVGRRYKLLRCLQANYSPVMCTGVTNTAKPPEV